MESATRYSTRSQSTLPVTSQWQAVLTAKLVLSVMALRLPVCHNITHRRVTANLNKVFGQLTFDTYTSVQL